MRKIIAGAPRAETALRYVASRPKSFPRSICPSIQKLSASTTFIVVTIHAGQIVLSWRGQARWRATKSDALRAQTNSDVMGELQEGLCRLCRPGGDLLSHALRRSTISAGEFNDRVRNGIGWRLPAKTTRPAKTTYCESLPSDARIGHRAEFMSNACGNKSLNGPFAAHEPLHASFRRSWHEDDQTNRAISTG